MTLKEKIYFVCNKYNNGILTNYAENMIDAIDEFEAGTKEYTMTSDAVTRFKQIGDYTPFPHVLIWELCYIIGECILNNDKNFFADDRTNNQTSTGTTYNAGRQS